MKRFGEALFALGLAFAALSPAHALDVRIAQQYGISYLPLTIMRAHNLLQAHGKQLGVDITPKWLSFTGGAPMNEALISNNLDFASGGVSPMLIIWDRTRSNLGVKAVASLNAMPLYLNTTDANVHIVKDFTAKDRIALPGARVSIQAIILQMAAVQAFGPDGANKLDGLTVSMSHPDGYAALINGTAGITAHFTSAPYMYEELAHPNVHRVLSSYDVLGGPHTFNVVWATQRFATANPKVMTAFTDALTEAMAFITQHPKEAAQIWIADEKSSLSLADAEKMIRDPENEWTLTPRKIGVFGAFMAKEGLLKQAPAAWTDVFFPASAAGLQGD
ncbi:MAG: ABC transporter substrate-binding protein [Pseudomonadota bacterium]|nr:ABC transporter substrate-binding protein [Pseudomonadota bacterium]